MSGFHAANMKRDMGAPALLLALALALAAAMAAGVRDARPKAWIEVQNPSENELPEQLRSFLVEFRYKAAQPT